MNYYPKGSLCISCVHRARNCSGLPFRQMPVHRADGIDAVVICTDFRRPPAEPRAK